jgi:hypothetical protein
MKLTTAKTLVVWCCATLFSCGIVAATVSATNQDTDKVPTTAVQWEFCRMKTPVHKPSSEVARDILRLGREGWELVSVENFSQGGDTTETGYYFKRRK